MKYVAIMFFTITPQDLPIMLEERASSQDFSQLFTFSTDFVYLYKRLGALTPLIYDP